MAFSTNLRGLRFVAMAVLIRNKYDSVYQGSEIQANQDLPDKAPVPLTENVRPELNYTATSVKKLKFI